MTTYAWMTTVDATKGEIVDPGDGIRFELLIERYNNHCKIWTLLLGYALHMYRCCCIGTNALAI